MSEFIKHSWRAIEIPERFLIVQVIFLVFFVILLF
jgi:hypothetical protein